VVLKELNSQLSVLEHHIHPENLSAKKIILKTFDHIHLVRMADIIYCESDDCYTRFHLMDGNRIMVSSTLKEYDELLGGSGFFRIHKSYLINLVHVMRFEKAEGGSIILTNNNVLPVASRKRDQLIDMLGRITGSI
jgi:two-component system LytT family response regulator